MDMNVDGHMGSNIGRTKDKDIEGTGERKIALGFHACVDFELEWDFSVMEHLIRKHGIHAGELTERSQIASIKDLMIEILICMRQGTGCEIIPDDFRTCNAFAEEFTYRTTIGGTAARAAIAIRKIGFESTLGMCCFNRYIENLLPPGIKFYSGNGLEYDRVYPHIILQYPSGVHIQANDIDFTVPCHNRILISRDKDSMDMVIAEDVGEMVRDADVFLLSCFSEVLDGSILRDRLDTVFDILNGLKDSAAVILEDGCYINKEFRHMVHRQLAPVLDIISMNEDELQDYVGQRIRILNPVQVMDAVRYIYRCLQVPFLIIHTHIWALAYGTGAREFKGALESGIMLASARYVHGDDFGMEEYGRIRTWKTNAKGEAFCRQVTESDPLVCCVACKDLDFVDRPTTVGLGDFFAGGLLPVLACRHMDTGTAAGSGATPSEGRGERNV